MKIFRFLFLLLLNVAIAYNQTGVLQTPAWLTAQQNNDLQFNYALMLELQWSSWNKDSGNQQIPKLQSHLLYEHHWELLLQKQHIQVQVPASGFFPETVARAIKTLRVKEQWHQQENRTEKGLSWLLLTPIVIVPVALLLTARSSNIPHPLVWDNQRAQP